MKRILAAMTMLLMTLSPFAQQKPRTTIDIKLIDRIDEAMTSGRASGDVAKVMSDMGLLPISSDNQRIQRFSNYSDFDRSYTEHPDAVCAVVSIKDGGEQTNSFSLVYFDKDSFANLLSQLDAAGNYQYDGSWTDDELIEHEFSIVGNGPVKSSLNLKAFRSGLCSVMYASWRN